MTEGGSHRLGNGNRDYGWDAFMGHKGESMVCE